MHGHEGPSGAASVILLIPFAVALLLYVAAVATEHRRGRRWPWYRLAAFVTGTAAAAAGFTGPLASSTSFTAHTAAHVMAGMLAPLLLVTSAPITLALRALHVSRARLVSRVLRSRAARVVSHPVTAGLLSLGGMWVLYATPLFALSQASVTVHLLVMTHTLLAGYLFTAALIGIDPSPHRAGFGLRMGVLVGALAAHAVLAKTIYADGLPGIALADVQAGAQLMYYAGDVIDAALAVVLCAQWYRAAGRARLRAVAVAVAVAE